MSVTVENALKIADFLAAAHVAVDVGANDKFGLIKELADRTAAALDLPSNVVLSALQKREELGSTGIGGGVAIPHARLSEVKQPFAVFIRLKSAIDFDAIDGQPVDLVFLLLLPAQAPQDQLNALAAVARKLRDRAVLRQLRSAFKKADLYRAIVG